MTEYVEPAQAALPLSEAQTPPAETKPETPKLKSPERLVILAALLGFAVVYFFYDKSLALSFPLFIALSPRRCLTRSWALAGVGRLGQGCCQRSGSSQLAPAHLARSAYRRTFALHLHRSAHLCRSDLCRSVPESA